MSPSQNITRYLPLVRQCRLQRMVQRHLPRLPPRRRQRHVRLLHPLPPRRSPPLRLLGLLPIRHRVPSLFPPVDNPFLPHPRPIYLKPLSNNLLLHQTHALYGPLPTILPLPPHRHRPRRPRTQRSKPIHLLHLPRQPPSPSPLLRPRLNSPRPRHARRFCSNNLLRRPPLCLLPHRVCDLCHHTGQYILRRWRSPSLVPSLLRGEDRPSEMEV